MQIYTLEKSKAYSGIHKNNYFLFLEDLKNISLYS